MTLSDSAGDVVFQGSANERSKNRVHVKNMYYRKLNVLDDLQHEVNTLQIQYENVLDVYHQRDAQPTSLLKNHLDHCAQNTTMKAYVEVAQMKQALVNENTELKRMNDNYLLMEKTFRQLKLAQDKAIILQHEVQEHKKKNPSLRVNSLVSDQYFKIAHDSYHEINMFRESKTCTSSGVSTFGWRDRHHITKNRVVFSLDKVFPGVSVEKMAQGMWQLVSDPELIEIMKPPGAIDHFHVMERPCENAVVFYYTLERPASDIRVRAFVLSMRIDLGSQGYLIIFRTLDPKTYFVDDEDGISRRGRKRVEPQKENVWLDAFIWNICEFSENGCRFTLGGKMNSTALQTVNWWYILVLQNAMTVETKLAGLPGLLCN